MFKSSSRCSRPETLSNRSVPPRETVRGAMCVTAISCTNVNAPSASPEPEVRSVIDVVPVVAPSRTVHMRCVVLLSNISQPVSPRSTVMSVLAGSPSPVIVMMVPARPRPGETSCIATLEINSKVTGPGSGASAWPKPGNQTVTFAAPSDGARLVVQHASVPDILFTSHWTSPMKIDGASLMLRRLPLMQTICPPATEPLDGLTDSTSADSASW
eukprot:scaffold54828_cov30-Tisochrysis_lutea.AAC.16